MKIAVIHDYADALRNTAAYPKLKAAGHEVNIFNDAYLDPARVVEQVKGHDVLLLTQQRVVITAQILDQLPQLKFISQTGRNVSHLDVKACTAFGIPLLFTPGVNHTTVAEHCFLLLLALEKNFLFHTDSTRSGGWKRRTGPTLR